MGRPTRKTVDYYQHYVKSGRTIYILENEYGNDGYAFWFKLLELLGDTDGHTYDCNNPSNWKFLLAKTRVSEATAYRIIQTLIELGKIDEKLWEDRLIWVQNFVDNLSVLYKRRQEEKPKKPTKEELIHTETQDKGDLCTQKPPKKKVKEIDVCKKPHSIVENSRVKNSISSSSEEDVLGKSEDFPAESSAKKDELKKEEPPLRGEASEQLPPSPPSKSEVERIKFGDVSSLWNEICESYPRVIKLSEKRKNKIRIRLKEMGGTEKGFEMLREIFQKMEDSNFLKGEKGFKADFDWVFYNDSNWVKVLEGKYNNKTNNNGKCKDTKWNDRRGVDSEAETTEAYRKRFTD